MEDTKLTCKKCGTQSNSKYCPNCGQKMFSALRTEEEIKFMEELISQASDLSKRGGPMGIVLYIAVRQTLDWVKGNSDTSPVHLLLAGEESKNDPKAKRLLELAQEGPFKKE